MGSLHGFHAQREMAHETVYHRSAQKVIGCQLDAAHDWENAAIDRIVVIGELSLILVVTGSDSANPRHAEGDQIAVRSGRIALEIALQSSLALSDRQFVVRLGEVIHPDIDETCVR